MQRIANLCRIVVLPLLLLLPAILFADTPAAPRREMTPADVEAFLDGLIPPQTARDDIAGAVVAIVKAGKLLFAKGYGYSDVAAKKPVDPENTLFRPARSPSSLSGRR